ncbi:hypothetical protein SRHO_G00097560 [Serrasalmus rhombeus]
MFVLPVSALHPRMCIETDTIHLIRLRWTEVQTNIAILHYSSSPDRYGHLDHRTCLDLDSAPHGPQRRRHSPTPPSSPHRTHHSSREYGRVQLSRTDSRRSFSPGSRYPTRHESSIPADFGGLQKPAYSPRHSASPWDRR